jgi:isochorismate hydrolase
MDNKTEQFNADIEKARVLHEWLQKLNVGDQVAVETYNYGTVSYSIRNVNKVMPTKIIVDSLVFHRNDGKQIRGKGKDMWGTGMEIAPITQYIRDEIQRNQQISHARYILSNFKQGTLNDLTLREASILCTHLDGIVDVVTQSIARMKEAQRLLVADQKLRIEMLTDEIEANIQEGEAPY